MAKPARQHLERGSALLVALMLMALTATIATTLAFRQSIVIQETTQALTTQQQYIDAQSIVDLAKAKLIKNAVDFQQDKKNSQAPIDTFPMTFDQTVNGVEISGEIIDAQGFFNINSLRDQNAQNAFVRLITLVDPDIDKKDAQTITNSIVQWISTPEQLRADAQNAQNTQPSDSTDITTPDLLNNSSSSQSGEQTNSVSSVMSLNSDSPDGGDNNDNANNSSNNSGASAPQSNDAVYLKKKPPYHPYHQLMANASELRLVDGMTVKLYDALMPYLIALPTGTLAVNVNTAPAMVLAATAQNFSLSMAQMVVEDRQDKTFDSLTAYESDSDLINVTVDSTILAVQTNYFIVRATVKSGNQTLTVYTLLKRTMGGQNQSQQGDADSAMDQTQPSSDQDNSLSQNSIPSSFNNSMPSTNSTDGSSDDSASQGQPKIEVLWQSIGSY